MSIDPDIILCIPGLWPSRSDIVTSIANQSGGYLFAGMLLLETNTHNSFQLEVQERDLAIVKAFEMAGRTSLKENDLAAITNHTYVLYLVAKGGYQTRARTAMPAAAALLRSGGLAVKVETTGKAHSIQDWNTLTDASDVSALYHAYVTLIGGDNVFYSCGMHNIGLPDAIVPGDLAPSYAAQLLQTFLLYLLLEQPTLKNGHTFSIDANSPRYRLQHQPCTLYDTDDVFFNPYGMWNLS